MSRTTRRRSWRSGRVHSVGPERRESSTRLARRSATGAGSNAEHATFILSAFGRRRWPSPLRPQPHHLEVVLHRLSSQDPRVGTQRAPGGQERAVRCRSVDILARTVCDGVKPCDHGLRIVAERLAERPRLGVPCHTDEQPGRIVAASYYHRSPATPSAHQHEAIAWLLTTTAWVLVRSESLRVATTAAMPGRTLRRTPMSRVGAIRSPRSTPALAERFPGEARHGAPDGRH